MKENKQINKTIIGEPGVGMSTTFKQIILDAILRGQEIIVVDPEKEYRDLQKTACKNMTFIKWKDSMYNRR